MKSFAAHFGAYLLKVVLTLFGITILSFLLGRIAPGDPAYALLSSDSGLVPTEEQLQAVRESLGLHLPLWMQYFLWLRALLSGDVGTSFISNRKIVSELTLRIPVTLSLSLLAILLMLVFSLLLGYALALHKDSVFDRLFLWLSSLFSAVPSFLLSLGLIYLFAQNLHWLPSSGMSGPHALILPAVSISLGPILMNARILRAELTNAFGEAYFTMARSKGFTYRFSAAKHALPNALVSMIPLWSNYFIGILGGSTVAENVFALPGMGQWILKSINSHDYPAIQAYVLVMGIICLAIYTLSDSVQLLAQPQVRRSSYK